MILPSVERKSVELLFQLLDVEIDRINKTLDHPGILSIAKGFAIYDPMKDKEYRDVFVRADQNMYADKENFHRAYKNVFKK